MSTIDQIKVRASEIMDKVNSGAKITDEEVKILSIFNSLNSGKAFNSGKRKVKKTGHK